MPFHFKKKESVSKAVRRLVCERIDDALKSLQRGDHLEGIHRVRKEIKKLRAILRLARGEIGKRVYRENTKALRAAANRLTALRDAQVRLNAFENLVRHFSRQLPARPLPKIKESLRGNYREEEKNFFKGNSVVTVKRILCELKRSVGDFKIKSNGWAAICPGLKKSYCRGQEALKAVREKSSPENFHEWRKRVKDLWHQIKLMCPAWRKELRAATDELKALDEFLGDDHDLVMLKEFLAEKFERAGNIDALDKLIGSRQKELRSAALKLGARFYLEKPNRFCGRIGNYWKIWRCEN